MAPTVGLIVEGATEFLALPRLFQKALVRGCPPLRAKNLGGVGSDKEPAAIAEMVAPKVIAYRAAGVERVVVCLDREQRRECSGQFAGSVASAIARELVVRRASGNQVHVVIADRTFEAWLLADAYGLHQRRVFVTAPTTHCFEGNMGAQNKKGTVELGRLLGRPYVKTTDGPAVFERIEFAAARAFGQGMRGSRSLDKFLRVLGV